MTLVEQTLTTFKSRLAEIEEQIAPLVAEADELRMAIDRLESSGTGRRAAPPGRASTKTRASRSGTRRSRAPRGAAREAILDAAKANPGATSGQVAEITGLPRNTVATTMSKLRAAGELPKVKKK